MKFCAQCGERLDDSCAFCSNCGAKQAGFDSVNAAVTSAGSAANTVVDNAGEAYRPAETAAEAYDAMDTAVENAYGEPYTYAGPEKRGKKKTGLFIGLGVLLAAIAAIAVLAATGAYAKLLPHSKLKLALAERRLFNAAPTKSVMRVLPEANKINADLELDVDIKPSDDLGGYHGQYYEKIFNVINDFRLYASLDTTDCLDLSLKGDYKGNTAADVRLYVDKEDIGVYLAPAADEIYTIERDALINKIAPDLDPRKTDFLFEEFDREAAKKDVEALKAIVTKAMKNADIDIDKKQTVKLFNGDEKIDGAVYTITMTEEQIEDMLTDIADYLDSEECYIASYADDVLALLAELEEKVDLDIYLNGISTSEDVVAELRESIPDIAEEFAEGDYRLEVVMKGNEIVRQRFCNDEGSIGYDSLMNGKNEQRLMLYFTDDDDLNYSDMVIRTEGNKINFTVDAETYDGAKAAANGWINTGKKSVLGTCAGEFDVTATDEDGDTVMTCRLTAEDTKGGMMHKITVTPGEYYTSEMKSIDVCLLAKEGDGVDRPAGAEVVDVSDYSDLKLGRLITGIAYKLYGNISEIFG